MTEKTITILPHSNKVTINTDTFEDRKIVQTIDTCGYVIRTVVDTQEKQTRNALIGLGWKPPEKEV